jgi:hypothetical protein
LARRIVRRRRHAGLGSQSSNLALGYSQGMGPNENDAGAFDAVDVTVVAMPEG